jgi:cysteine-rich repeat protein
VDLPGEGAISIDIGTAAVVASIPKRGGTHGFHSGADHGRRAGRGFGPRGRRADDDRHDHDHRLGSSTTTTTLGATTFLKCYKAIDPLALQGPSPSWLQLDSPGMAAEHCRISGGFRLVCVPASAELTAPIESRMGSGGAFKPLTPIELPTEEVLNQDRVCYKIRCQEPATIDQNTTFTDQFATRKLSRYKPYIVCGPAVTALCGDGHLDFGEQCDDGNLTNGDCCDSKCHFEPTTQACGTDTDGNPCTAPRCDGAGTCTQNGFLPGAVCPDTDGNVCTSARCDGAGSCDQNGFFAPNTTSCPDTDGDACTVPMCDGNGTCNQTAVIQPDGSPCVDKDGNACTLPRCNAGTCNQTVLAPLGASCPDTDGDQCTDAACDGNGLCVQNFFVRNCTFPQTCDHTTGLCQ